MATATQSKEQQTSENRIEVCISSLKRDKELSKVYSAFCGLINSHGGFVTISLRPDELGEVIDARDLERRIRQKFAAILGFDNMRDVIINQTSELSASKMLFKVEGMSQLCTLHYNIYIPTELQIIPLGSANEVQRILQPKRIIELDPLVQANDYDKVLVYGKPLADESVCLESKTRQYKLLKAAKANRTSLAERMTNNNKFANTISAFANHRGGHVYYGIDDDGIVYGEYVEDKNKIIEKVSKAINETIWLSEDETFTPKKGKHWNIFFEPVIDEKGREKTQTFVIVIYISYCRGGVFATEPESYQIVNGEVVHIPFQEWKRRLLHSTFQICPVAKSNFRTDESQENYYAIMETMMDLRNRDKREDFITFISDVKQKFKTVDVQLSTLSQEATYAFRSGKFDQAEKFIQVYDSLQPQCEENMLIPGSMGLYIKSANKRARGQYQESYELAKEGLQTADMLTSGLIQAWFCTHIALLANILANKESDTGKRVELVNEAKCLLGNALSYSNHVKAANKLGKAVVDLQQKVYIHLSQLYLGLSLNGSLSSYRISAEDVRLARNCLSMVAELEREQKLSPSREVQYLLALSALLFREYKLGISTGDGYLGKCYEAIELATDNKFKEMLGYCQNLKKSFEGSD